MKGYKAFNKDWKCRDMQYEIGESYEMDEKPIICERGYHFCANPIDVFGYYPISDNTLIAEVEAYGDIEQEGTKYVTNKIHIVKEFTRKNLQALILDGNNNSGHCNSGNCNSGDYNSGNYNSGNCNSGDYNSGNYNSGNYNSGNCNSGDYNSGNCNSGNCNSGDYNSGIFNTDEPTMRAFNKDSGIKYSDFIRGLDYNWYCLLGKIHGRKLNAEDWKRIKAIPNYDAEIFEQITGLKEE